MKSILTWLAAALLLAALSPAATAGTVQVFSEPGFPTADTAPLSDPQLHSLLPGAAFVDTAHLPAALTPDTTLLVLPYGSAFPEADWPAIHSYLERGGNLLVLGGRPFTRAAFLDAGVWKLRDPSMRFSSELLIDQYEQTPSSAGLRFQANPDTLLPTPAFSWQRAFSPILHLSASRLSERGGSAGRIDARIDALAWGDANGRHLAAPAVQIDHLHARFTGGRWVLLTSDLPPDFASTAGPLLASLVQAASHGAQDFHADPEMPLYLPGEPVQLHLRYTAAAEPHAAATAQVTLSRQGAPGRPTTLRRDLSADLSGDPASDLVLTLPPPASSGLYRIDATLLDHAGHPLAIAHSGFWIRDLAYLASGPRLTVNADYFELNGKPLAVVGTTYMASDVQRLYYEHPNVAVWDRDLGQIAAAGLNMLRTGWWSGWAQLCDENGMPTEHTLRTLEAYLMTARKYNLPVQFNVFAFLPDVLGGANAYLDPVSLEREKTLYAALAQRFGTVPFLAWDLINEPSFSQNLWTSRPNGDPIELARWNTWLATRYPSRADMAAAWNVPCIGEHGTIPVPSFVRASEGPPPPLNLYDFYLFSQDTFAAWVAEIRRTLRAAGSHQLITVGQDEGGNSQRLLPAYFGDAVDFTTNHSWSQNDNLLWNSLLAKQPGKMMLIQEMGAGAGIGPDRIERRDPDSQAALFERKVILSFAQGSGAIEWLWNTNADMVENGEVALGGVRADRTEKPETEALRGLAAFAAQASPHLLQPQQPQVAIVTSQATQFSALQDQQTQAQQRAVQALCSLAHTPAYLVAENQLARLGHPALVLLPSPQALGEPAWQALLAYVHAGGSLLVTGPLNRDTHLQSNDRFAPLHLAATVEPLTYRTATLPLPDGPDTMTFNQAAQNTLEAARFSDGHPFQQLPWGAGHLYWSAFPVELADEPQAAARLYTAVLQAAGIQPPFAEDTPLPPGVLVYPTLLKDAILYLFASTYADETPIALRDQTTGARLSFLLPAERAAALLLDRSTGAVLAQYNVATPIHAHAPPRRP